MRFLKGFHRFRLVFLLTFIRWTSACISNRQVHEGWWGKLTHSSSTSSHWKFISKKKAMKSHLHFNIYNSFIYLQLLLNNFCKKQAGVVDCSLLSLLRVLQFHDNKCDFKNKKYPRATSKMYKRYVTFEA